MADLELGVLAEDLNDCEVIRVLCRRILEERGIGPGTWRLHPRSGKGCAKLRRKAASWLVELANRGCHAAIILHDLDRNPLNGELNDVVALERELSAISVPRRLTRLICIPVEEIEAWFFSSEKALSRACGEPQKPDPSPHKIRSPRRSSSRCHAMRTSGPATLRTTMPSLRSIWTWSSVRSGASHSMA